MARLASNFVGKINDLIHSDKEKRDLSISRQINEVTVCFLTCYWLKSSYSRQKQGNCKELGIGLRVEADPTANDDLISEYANHAY